MPNGLTLILSEDHSDPLVHVDVTYHVGSAREEIGKSGFAHFFEHMMFEGSDDAPKGTHDKIISGNGGSLNGSTNRDRTNYYETIPANLLQDVLWLEADRMGFLLGQVTQPRFEVQRATVKTNAAKIMIIALTDWFPSNTARFCILTVTLIPGSPSVTCRIWTEAT